MENINYDENNFSAQDFLKQMAIAQQMMAERPQKKSESVFTTKTSTPYALEDMLALRDRIGNASRDLDRDLAKRETFMYSLANALSQMPQQEGPGSWVSALGRGFGAGYAGRTNALVDRAQKRYQAEMKDIEERAALDKMMGSRETSSQHTDLGYTPMEYSTNKDDKTQKPEVYDFTPAELPSEKTSWGEWENQGVLRVDPNTGARTLIGAGINKATEGANLEGVSAMGANQTAYAETFTTRRIKEIADAAGGQRGIDTMPEITFKGGPELSANNMSSKRFAEAVRNRAYNAADQIIKANPNATITREELANAFINDFNHKIRKEYRVVEPLEIRANKNQRSVSPIVGEIVDGIRFLGYDENGKMILEEVE